jgi:hypothetical protein
MDCRAYQSGTAIEFWVEAEVEGRIICWWLEARCEGGGWVVEAEVLENRDDRDGQEKLHRLEPRAVSNAAALGEAIRSAAGVLLATASAGKFIAVAS